MMSGRGRRLRFATVLVAVVLALTGFSTSGGSSGKSKGKSSGGGGCSSSKSAKKKSHVSSGKGGDSTPAPRRTQEPATAVVTSCLGGADGRSTVIAVTSRLDRPAAFEVVLYREDANGVTVESARGELTLEARGRGDLVIAMTAPEKAGEVKNCRVGPVSTAAGAASPKPTRPTRDASTPDASKPDAPKATAPPTVPKPGAPKPGALRPTRTR
ncbi:hypothetical protein [Streptomyces sp. NPDC031705]|uniref:hypothetical protein n=1 Tax=Streptomyces sp. NPDC031705 TaxID=3155729 RepID=UPI0033F01D9D